VTKLTNSTDCSPRRIIAYWVTTVFIAAEFAVGGVMDILRLPPFFAILKHLGYPGYFSVILGVCKVLVR
jgi:DoxX-like family